MNWVEEKPEEIICVQKMVEEVTNLTGAEKTSVYFRGQDRYTDHLFPTIGRTKTFVGKPGKFDLVSERNLLHRFSRYSSLELGRVPSEWEALFLARHHNLPVRLLDWTSNPLFALFCAAQSEKELKDIGNAAVWAILKKPRSPAEYTRDDIDILAEESKTSIEKDDGLYYQSLNELPVDARKKTDGNGYCMPFDRLQKPLRLKGIRLIYPFHVTPRMFTEDSFFTIQDDPWTPLDGYDNKQGRYGGPYLKDNAPFVDIQEIVKWEVPRDCRLEIVKQLSRLGIDNRKVFPDFDGLAKGIWQLEVLRDS